MNCQFKYVTVLCVAIAVKVTSLKANMMKIDVFGSIILLTCMALVGSANAFGAIRAQSEAQTPPQKTKPFLLFFHHQTP